MSDNKVKISNILENQLPEFILDDNPLFREFLEQYYLSLEHDYGTVDLAENIAELKNIDRFADLKYTAVPPVTTTVVFNIDDIIEVSHTAGFPAKNGLIKIDNEIITYTGKTANSFTGCVRGFSGIDRISSDENPEFLNFNVSQTEIHGQGSIVTNLSFIFLAEFFKKYKKSFLPGLEDRQFQNVNIDNILSRARDFYSSKGTDSSLKILFSVLFGKYVDVIKPFDYTIRPSDAEWSLSDVIIVEPIGGNPSKLQGTTLLQSSIVNPTAKGTVARIQSTSLSGKQYYKVFFTRGSIENKIEISKKTKVLGVGVTDTTLTVDSTIGFPESGSFYNKGESNRYSEVTYINKNSNQFFGCVGLSTTLIENDPIIDGNFIYGYEDNDTSKLVTMRVVGTVVDIANNTNNTNKFSIGDIITVGHLGEKLDESDIKFNSWFYNNVTLTNVGSTPSPTIVNTEVDHYLHVGDRVDILLKDSRLVEESNRTVTSILSKTQFQINAGTLDSSKKYIVKKKLDFVNENLNTEGILANIQNTFTDKDKNTYVAFSGLPGYDDVSISNRSKEFTSSDIDAVSSIITINSHNFKNGEKVYNETNSSSTTLTPGNYYVNVINNNSIRLSLSNSSLENNTFLNITGVGATDQYKLTPSSLFGSEVVDQNNFKRIYKTPKPAKNHNDIIGAIGVALNGVEFNSPVGEDSIFYGQVDSINILNNGSNYDIVNAPQLSVIDDNGTGADVIGNFKGKVEDIILVDSGFNYVETPTVTISGGNGTEATAEAKMRGFTYSEAFNDFSVGLTNNKITLSDGHKFINGEEVTYLSTGTPIGIGSTAVGFGTDRLTSGATYFINKHNNTEFSLTTTKERALAGIGTIEFVAFGNKEHTLRSRKNRRIIDRIVVDNSTDDFTNKKVIIDGIAWPPIDQKNLYTTFVGINTENNYIYAKNHSFENGDNVEYTFDGTSIGGLSTGVNYKVTVLDSDRFHLSEAGTASSISSVNYQRKIYENLTSVGVGTHTFQSPSIVVTIDGLVSVGDTSSIPSYYTATATPVVRGSLDSVFIRNGGVGYGVTDIINYQKNPQVKVLSGKDADIRVLISDGKISGVYVSNSGSEYTTPPTLNVIGAGSQAKLNAIIVNGSISAVNIVNPGSGYEEGTIVEVIPTGENAKLSAEIHRWQLNNVERYAAELSIANNRDLIQMKSSLPITQNKVVSFYPGKKLRELLSDNLDVNGDEKTSGLNHSPIVGWAYDGNPIYGPYGNGKAVPDNTGTGGVKKITSSYEIDSETSSTLRPPGFNDGFFVQDFVYKASGDLDEYNGRYIVNNDFPNGTYAYFSSLDINDNLAYPYITKAHYNQSDSFNYDPLTNQSDSILNNGQYKRNVTHLGMNDLSREYPFLENPLKSPTQINVDLVKSGKIDSITVEDAGSDYKVGEKIIFNEPSINAQIDQILGKEINNITTSEIELENTIFSVRDNVVTGITTTPHTFLDTDTIEISGISSSTYKNIEGFRKISVKSVNASVRVAIANTTITGITTDIILSDSTITRKFVPDDIIKVGDEEMQIVRLDDINNKYKVTRIVNDTVGSAHTAGKLVTKLSQEFAFSIDRKVENKNIDIANKENFDISAVGIGSTYTSAVVGVAGSKNITVSIPPRAIYIKNHKFNTGDELNIVSVGGTINASASDDLSSQFDLATVNLFAVKIGTDFIGLATSKAGVATSSVYFVNNLTGKNHTLVQVKNNITGIAKKVSANVMLETPHTLKVNDEVKLDITPNKTQDFVFKYNPNIQKLVVDPKSFAPTGITTVTTSEITIENHGLQTGDVVAYVNSVGIATPLQNNNQYYVIKISDSKIRLAETNFDSKVFPYQNIIITEQGHGTHEISKVNPKLDVINGGLLAINVSDTSLQNFDINFYTDDTFNSRFESKFIRREGTIGDGGANTKIIFDLTQDIPKNLYYRIEGDDANFTDTYPSSVNEDVTNYSNICIVDSKFNQNYRITSVASTTFNFTLVGSAETTSYTSTGFSSAFYSTNSITEVGGIHATKIINPGIELTKFPSITSIGTTTGKNTVLKVNSAEIGKISDNTSANPGIEYLSDKTLTPKADTNIILNVINTKTLNSIGIVTSGNNYTTPPTVIGIGNSNIITKTTLQSGSVLSVDIVANDSNLSEDLRIVAINNSNGVSVTNATSAFQINTLSLRAPITGFTQFPFEIGDDILVENIQITDDVDGYNSSDYDYKFFTVSGINTVGGTESISYSIAGLGFTGGTYNNAQNASFGRVIKASDLATFKPEFKSVRYTEGEKIIIDGTDTSAIVAKNGWDEESSTLKINNVIGDFKNSSVIRGIVGNFKSTILDKSEFDFDLVVGSTSSDYGIWKTDIGKLNDSLQRIHDNDYYQRFSYSIRGEIALEEWQESINSLNHVAGYKNFSDLQILTASDEKIPFDTDGSDVNLTVELASDASVHTRMYYDFASEDTETTNLSKIIKFDSKVITDYNESRTNKVLMIDDISSQFTGITTSIGGGIVGLSTFNIFSDSNSILHHSFNPATGIDITDSTITIPDHNFNTGEKLIYDPTNAGINTGSPIGIVTDSAPGVASTDILPSFVYAIKISDDTFKVAISKTNALSGGTGIAMTITNAVGIGSTQSFSVETDLASSRSIITIDNIIQSPLARKDVIVGLSTAVGIGSTQISVTDVSNIVGKSLIKIENEILKVDLVGVGATNVLNIQRGAMGTVAAAHTVGAATTIISGDYRINQGKIYFSDPPYGPSGIGSLTTNSTFSGRIYYRLDYEKNLIMDDISEEFNGTQDKFNLKSNGQQITGINTSFGVIMINNIFQKPFYGDVGSILESDYRIVGTGETADFTGTGREDLPSGGIINEFSVGVGSNYQVPAAALGIAVVNGSGVITGVNVGVGSTGVHSGGAGYLFPPNVSIADTLGNGVGAAVTATIGAAGTITGFTVNNGGTGYTQSSPPLVSIDAPSPYKGIPLTGGSGSGAKMDVVVGTGGSVISFNIANRGIGYEIGDQLFLTGLPFNPVGVGSTDFSITVRNKYQDKFGGWTFGQLLELDDFSYLFNGSRKTFLLTRTISSKEYYSIVAQDGSGIILANNLMIFLNDVLQKPNTDYVFKGGTRLSFREAPKAGSRLKIYFYVGSEQDYVSIDVDETIKPGDRLRLQTQDLITSQDERIIYELIASDTVETETYAGVGIVTDSSFLRPVAWTKQTSDLIIDGQIISKERSYLEPLYFPSSNVIASVGSTDTKIYVNDTWAFQRIDDLGQTLNDIRVVGVGTTAVVETIKKVTYDGDFGIITAIGASATGIGTDTPMLEFYLDPDPTIYNPSPNDKQISRSGISTGDYFVIRNTTLGAGVTSIDNHTNNVVATSNSFVDNVYRAAQVVSIGSSSIRVSANVDSLTGINTLTQPTNVANYGTYSWGVINTGTRPVSTAKSFTFHNTNGLAGIETSTHVSRQVQLRVSYT
jgi:hypothetical protein